MAEKEESKETVIDKVEDGAQKAEGEVVGAVEGAVKDAETEGAKVEAEAVKVEEGFVQEVEKLAEDVVTEVEGIFGVKRKATTHGTQDAAIVGLQTDADTSYVHPSQLPKA